ncbi:unnamed protein product, partial [Candidula unifasciata]
PWYCHGPVSGGCNGISRNILFAADTQDGGSSCLQAISYLKVYGKRSVFAAEDASGLSTIQNKRKCLAIKG